MGGTGERSQKGIAERETEPAGGRNGVRREAGSGQGGPRSRGISEGGA